MMRNLALVIAAAAMVIGGVTGCAGGSATPKPGLTGTGGGDGAAGTGADAGSSAAGTTGAAGDASVAGTTGSLDAAAGMTGTADGAAGTPPPAPTYCDTATKKTLPYDIESDFTNIHPLNDTASWTIVANPNCDQTVFPPLTPPSDGGIDGDAGGVADGETEAGADAASDVGADAGVETTTLELDANAGDAAPDGGVSDAASVDAQADGVVDTGIDAVEVSDSGSDAKFVVPACYEFTYDADACVAANGGVAAGALTPCWSGVIFEAPNGQPGPGICVASGAMHVSFEARASKDGAIIKFGSIGEGLNTTEFYTTLTTSWATYTTAIPANNDYNGSASAGGVWNGFSVVAEPQSHIGGTYIFVRNIQWIAQ